MKIVGVHTKMVQATMCCWMSGGNQKTFVSSNLFLAQKIYLQKIYKTEDLFNVDSYQYSCIIF